MRNVEPAPPSPSNFARLGQFCYHRWRWVLALWVGLLILSLILLPRLDQALTGTGTFYEAGPAYQAEQRLQQELRVTPDDLSVVFEASQGQVEDYQTAIDRMIDDTRSLSAVNAVTTVAEQPNYRSDTGQVAYSIINLAVDGSDAFAAIDQIQQILTDNQTENLNTYLVGQPVVDQEAQRISREDLSRSELLTLPLTLIALLFVFGSAIAATMPIAMALMTVSVTLGLLWVVTLAMDISIFALSITTMLGLGVGIDFCLLIVSRFREELVSSSVEQAVVRTVDTAGRAVFYSGLTTCIGLVSLLLFPIVLLRSLGVAASLVVFMSVAAALTLVPALLSVVGTRINYWQVVRPAPERGRMWSAIAQTIMRHSVAAVAFVLVVIGVLTSPFFNAQFGLGDADILPTHIPARQGVEVIREAFGEGETAPILLAVSTTAGDSILTAEHLETLYNFVEELEADPRVATVSSVVNLNPDFDLVTYQQLYQTSNAIPDPVLQEAVDRLSTDSTTLVAVISQTNGNDPQSRELVRDLRDRPLEDLRLQVGGQTALALDTIQIVYQRFPWVLVSVLIVTFVSLCLLFNSVVLPIQAFFLNLMSIAASFGALVFIFQDGNFQNLLDFAPLGYLDVLLPVVLFCVLFGLSMDYEVFLLTRIKEAYDSTGHNRHSIVEGLERTGRIITSAALLMIIVTGSFAFTSIIFVKALGLGIALAVLIDSTLVRAILVPASMNLMGRWNWWAPKFLRLDRVNIKTN